MNWLDVANALVMAILVFVLVRCLDVRPRCALCGGRLRGCTNCDGSECLRCGRHLP